MVLSVALPTLVATSPVCAATLVGVTMADQATVGGKNLVLNGLGLRTATIFNVKVYVSGLYLKRKNSEPKAIINTDEVKRVEMHFVHDVRASELRDGWSEAFDGNYPDVTSIKAEIAKFNASMRDVKEGDSIALDFHGTAVDVLVNGKKTDSVGGPAFQRAALSIWLGPKPPSAELKAGVLGN